VEQRQRIIYNHRVRWHLGDTWATPPQPYVTPATITSNRATSGGTCSLSLPTSRAAVITPSMWHLRGDLAGGDEDDVAARPQGRVSTTHTRPASSDARRGRGQGRGQGRGRG
jgi:hypothetical protein